MPDTPYRVVFSGTTIPGYDRDTAIRNFAQLLKRTPEQVAGAFSGKASVLKKGLSEAEAEKYCRVLEKAGLMVHAERESAIGSLALADEAPAAKPSGGLSLALQDDNAPVPAAAPKPEAAPVAAPKIPSTLALVEDDEHREARIAAEQQKAAASGAAAGSGGVFTCPACGHQQPRAEICSSCHVVIAKFLLRKAEKDKLEAERAAKAAAAAAPFDDVETEGAKPSILGKLFGKLKRD